MYSRKQGEYGGSGTQGHGSDGAASDGTEWTWTSDSENGDPDSESTSDSSDEPGYTISEGYSIATARMRCAADDARRRGGSDAAGDGVKARGRAAVQEVGGE